MASLSVFYQQLVELPASRGFCELVGLPKLAPYWPALVALTFLCQLLRLASNSLSSAIFGKKFDALTDRQKYDWGIRVVSQVHAVAVVILATPIFFKEELVRDTLYGFNHYASCVYTIVCG